MLCAGAAAAVTVPEKKVEESRKCENPNATKPIQSLADINNSANEAVAAETDGEKTLVNAVKPKHKRKKKVSSNANAS